MKKGILTVLVLGVMAWPSARLAGAQGEPNDIVVLPRVIHGGDPNSTFDFLKALPVIAFADTKVSHPGQFANRHDWAISMDGEEPFAFGIDNFFDLSFDLTLTGTPPGTKFGERKEAGIAITTACCGDQIYFVNTDGHEVVTCCGPLPFFYAFNQQEGDRRVTYNSGDKINLRFRYFRDTDMRRKVELFANGISTGPLDLTNNEQGIPSPFFVKGYLQTVINTDDPDNRAVAVFDNIRFNGKLIGN